MPSQDTQVLHQHIALYTPLSNYSKGIPHFLAQDSTIDVKELVSVGLRPMICAGVRKSEYPVLAEMTSSGSAEKKPRAASARPGSGVSKPATKTAGSHSGLNCQWIRPLGKSMPV